jgi:c(7)-type cytochrome triheme protein
MQSEDSQGKKADGTFGLSVLLLMAFMIAALGLPLAVLAMPESIRIPQVNKHGKGDPTESALFSHWEHDQFQCYACHTSIFPQKKMGFTHEDMEHGKYCAACHDGKTAWKVDDDDVECETCHVEKN